MKVCTACTALTALLIAMPISMAQDASRRIARGSPGSCPGGKAVVGDIELAAIPLSLDQLVRMSQLIIVEGTVIAVLPSINSNPSFASSVETDSLISVEQVLYGTLPTGLHTVALAQQGGTTAQCELVVPVDPLVKQNEQYFLFLWPDNRKAE